MQTPYGEIPDRLARQMRPQQMQDYLRRAYGRRTVLRTAGLSGLAAAASPVLWRQPGARTARIPPGPRWITLGPDPATQVYVSWSAGGADLQEALPRPGIRIGHDASYGTELQAGSTAQVPTPALAGPYPAQRAFYNTALISGLTPGHSYHYAVSNDGVTWSPGASFRTAPGRKPGFRFTAFGDQAASPATAAPMVRLAARLRPALHLVMGDLAYATTHGAAIPQTGGFRPRQWDKYLHMIGRYGAQSIPWQASVGSHEIEPLDSNGYAGFITRFPHPYDYGSGSPVVYAYSYSSVAFVHLDGNDLSAQETINTGYTAGAQTAWLDSTLARFRAARSGIDFIVVVCNCCCYSSNARHGSDGGLRAAWGPLFDKYTVDLVLSGHVHAYERTHPIRGGHPTRHMPPGGIVRPQHDGTTYICAGGGGNKLYRTWYGLTGRGDGGLDAPPRVWQWSEGQGPAGGSGHPENVPDPVRDYSAVRRAAYQCVVADLVPARAPGGETSLHVRAIMPGQGPASVTSISRLAILDSVTLTRTSGQA